MSPSTDAAQPSWPTAVRAGVIKDLRRRRADPWALAGWLAVPLMIGGLITFISSGGSGGGAPTIPLLVTNHDQSILSEFLIGALERAPDEGMLDVTVVEEEEGRARVTAGEASALLVIPAGFTDAALREEPAILQLWSNPAERIRPQVLQTGLDLAVDGHFYLHRVFGEELHTLADLLEAKEASESAALFYLAAGLAPDTRDKVDHLKHYLAEDLIVVEPPPRPQSAAAVGEDSPTFALLLFPGLVMMTLLFTAQGLAEEFWRERELGTLRRQVSGPLGLRGFLEAKVLATAAVVLTLTGIVLGLGFAYHGLPWLLLPPALGWVVLVGIVFYLLLALIQVHAPTRRAGSLISQFLIFPLMMVGGSFFPVETLPDLLGKIGRWTPNGYAVEKLKALLLGDVGIAALAVPALILVGLAVALFLWVARRTARSFAVVA